jgi:hypothetical protein
MIMTMAVMLMTMAVMIETAVVVMAQTEKAAADGNSGDGGRDGISKGTLVCK